MRAACPTTSLLASGAAARQAKSDCMRGRDYSAAMGDIEQNLQAGIARLKFVQSLCADIIAVIQHQLYAQLNHAALVSGSRVLRQT